MSLKSLLVGAALSLTLALPALADIEIHHPYARSSNPMAGAAFMVIYNRSDTDDRLLSVTSDAAARTELHTHVEDENGVMRMTHVEEGFVLPAGGELLLTRGDVHVMFMGLTDPFEQDARVTITLHFEQAGEVIVDIPVDQTREATHGMDHDMGDGMDHDMDHEVDHGEMDHGSDG